MFTSQIWPNSPDRDFLKTHDAHITFSWKDKIYLESDTEPIVKAMILEEFPQPVTNLENEHLLQDVPMQFWALFWYRHWQD